MAIIRGRKFNWLSVGLALAIATMVGQSVQAQELDDPSPPAVPSEAPTPKRPRPLWELGALGAAVYMPDYPAANEFQWRFLPLPYFRYRGQVFRADENSTARVRFIKNSSTDFDMSAAAAFPVGRNENSARAGMPELDWIGELGPRLVWSTDGFSDKGRLSLSFPLRAVFTTNFRYAKYLGIKFSPSVSYRFLGLTPARLGVLTQLGLTVTSEGVADQFYQVDASYARPERPSYDAKAGFLSTDATVAVFKRQQTFELFTALRYADYHGSKNENSPLFKSHSDFSVFVGLAYLFYQSQTPGFD